MVCVCVCVCDAEFVSLSHPLTFSSSLCLLLDFGGQEEYRCTQPLFMSGSDRTLFLLVCPMDHDVDETAIKTWIQTIAMHAPRAMIRLVASKVDACTGHRTLDMRLAHFFTYARDAVLNIAGLPKQLHQPKQPLKGKKGASQASKSPSSSSISGATPSVIPMAGDAFLAHEPLGSSLHAKASGMLLLPDDVNEVSRGSDELMRGGSR
jgi:hypothetical protein